MSKLYLLPVAAAVLAAVHPALAATDEPVETMVITATRSQQPVSTVPATVSVIDGETLRQQLAVTDDLSQILGNLLPSFSPSRQKMTGYGETLRGREPLIMIDGVPQSTPLRNGSREGYIIDPAMIERIEIIHGASAIQGMGASGGIINFITKSAGDEAHELGANFSVPTTGGSDTQSYKGSYLFNHKGERTELVTGVSYTSNGIYLDGNGDPIGFDTTQGDTQDADGYDLFVKGKLNLSERESLQLMANHFVLQGNGNYSNVAGNKAENIPATAVEGSVEGDPAENEVTTASLDYQHQSLYGGAFALQLFATDFEALYGGGRFSTFADPAYGGTIFDQSRNVSKKYGSRLTWGFADVGGSAVDLTGGLDWLRDTTYQDLAQTGRKWVPETTFNNYAPFLQARYSGIDNWTFSAGARYEWGELQVDDFTTLYSSGSTFVEGGNPSFDELLYNAGAVWQLLPELRLYASYSEGFGMPDVGRVLRAINTPGQDVDDFLNLAPIISDNREIGSEWDNQLLRARLSYYQSYSDLGQRLQANADGIFEVMREKTEIDGVEAEVEVYLAESASVGAIYARTDGQYDSNGDGEVDRDLGGVNVAPERLNLYWLQQWQPAISSRLQANLLFDADFNDGTSFDGYTTWDLTASYQSQELGLFTLGVENLTNEQYITYHAQTTGTNDTYYAGIGRLATLSWQYRF